MEAEWAKKCYVVLVNEIVPRAKKLNIPISEFMDSKLSSYLTRLEYDGVITRKQLRELLDEHIRHIEGKLNMKDSNF